MKKDKNIDRNDRYRRTIFYWVSGFSLFISIIALCGAYIYKGVIIEKESVVLLFVGFLTTFIVIGNYAQVKSIEQDFSQKVGELNHEFSEKVKELKNEFDEKVLLNQTFSVIKELYEKLADLNLITEELISSRNDKRKELVERGKQNTSEYINLLNINRFILPSDIFSMLKKIEELLSNCFNNSKYIHSTNDNDLAAEQRTFDKLIADIARISKIREEIEQLLKDKYFKYE